jgi:hypothetical protein
MLNPKIKIYMKGLFAYMELSIPCESFVRIFQFRLDINIIKDLETFLYRNGKIKIYELRDNITGVLYRVEFHALYGVKDKYIIFVYDMNYNSYQLSISDNISKNIKKDLVKIIKNY